MLTIADLEHLDPSTKVATVLVADRAIPVRGLSAAESAELDVIFPDPIPPTSENKKTGRREENEFDPGYQAGLENADRKRRAARAAIAAGYTAQTKDGGAIAWTRENLGGVAMPIAHREGPGQDRVTYARLAAAQMMTIGESAIERIRMASIRLEAGETAERVTELINDGETIPGAGDGSGAGDDGPGKA